MKLKLISLLCLLLTWFNASSQQYGPMTRTDLHVNKYRTFQALVYIPEMKDARQKFPLILCFHGRSIAGKDPSKIFREGVTRQMKEGRKIEAVNKADGKKYQFIVVAPLVESWSFRPQDLNTVLDDIIKKYPVDVDRVYLTGYSAGGWAVESAKTHDATLSARIAACITMSPAMIDADHIKGFKLAADANIHTWYFTGKKEAHFNANTKQFIDSTNKYKTGLTKLTEFDGGHCCWHSFYDPSYRENGMNIYEWLLQFKRKK
ncbi:carboxylesterase family protein [Chitinophaga cymbidii]|uniref:Peptidase S9 prolyl oligopeptidase catalytic domain-containing protein n=1 Tax=Chitinophaga cymbidii TaxID=1096750 RepID=A0A512RRQ7_9BACT|nr:hypothetical protein [Chitinophaga cymbidii]GEP98356.1 hypothetical protein CCY01nite_46160 [Chitinophaga cymbidii]